MSTEPILARVARATTKLLPGQSRTPVPPVAAAVRTERPDPAALSRTPAGPVTAKAAIKRAWRLTDNRRVEVADARAGVIARPVRRREERLLASFDWTEVVLLADRGFGRAEWAAVCREPGFRDVVRIKPAVTVARARYRLSRPRRGLGPARPYKARFK